ncbi:MAG TPA: HPF/RaiA family ribosome-associated protein [Actinomycetota bacterium]|jgi:ribosome-associated translation inhibitor RaiA|nr:HPF/RaiA family ribosome-associated protein [Actinomycetota bacterium]
MLVRIASPSTDLSDDDRRRIEEDLQKIQRRLPNRDVQAEVRVKNGEGHLGYHVVIELDYGRTHLSATEDHTDVGQAVRSAREDLLRQINDRSRRGHSSFAKGI